MVAEVQSWLARLQGRGVALARHLGGLRVRAPRGALTEAEWAEVTERKEEILAALDVLDDAAVGAEQAGQGALPFLTGRGDLVIPQDSSPRYRWWQRGQSIRATLEELGAPPEIMRRYCGASAP